MHNHEALPARFPQVLRLKSQKVLPRDRQSSPKISPMFGRGCGKNFRTLYQLADL